MLRNPFAHLGAVHPGEKLATMLDERGIRQSQLARAAGTSNSYLSDVIRCQRRMSVSLALKLEKPLNIEAEYWMSLQVDYDLFVARIIERAKKPRRKP